VKFINEMEWIDGMVWANIWYSDRIAVIDPGSGLVLHYLTVPKALYPKTNHRQSRDAVCNGIAYDAQSKRLWITGKWWSKLYEIEMPQLNLDSA
jgi:glutamine cyclotransferase